jgi:carbonic anhydrase
MANINPNNSAICDLKCKYTFNYIDSDVNIISEDNVIKILYNISFQQNSKETVTYNSNIYNPMYIHLIYPSSNKYNGKNADAEIIIIHESKTAGFLFVCIPILISNETTVSSKLLGQIIDKSYTNSLIKDYKYKEYSLNDKINLNDLIPMKKYYSDKFKLRNDNKSTEHNIIVFSIDDKAYITIKQDHYNKLIKTIKKNTTFGSNIIFTNTLYSNIKGPTISGNVVEDDIYIDCKPYTEDDIDVYESESGKQRPPSNLSSSSLSTSTKTSETNNLFSSSFSSDNSNTINKTFNDYLKSPLFLILFIIIITLLSIGFISLLYKFFRYNDKINKK